MADKGLRLEGYVCSMECKCRSICIKRSAHETVNTCTDQSESIEDTSTMSSKGQKTAVARKVDCDRDSGHRVVDDVALDDGGDPAFQKHGYEVQKKLRSASRMDYGYELDADEEVIEFQLVDTRNGRRKARAFRYRVANCRRMEQLLNWRWLRHPNILRLIEYFVDGQRKYLYCVCEAFSDEDVASRLKNVQNVARGGGNAHRRETLCKRWTGECLTALAHAHHLNLYHNNFHWGNVLLDRHDNAKLADFRLLRHVPPAKRVYQPYPKDMQFRSPDAMKDGRMSAEELNKSELWSVAASLLKVLLNLNVAGPNLHTEPLECNSNEQQLFANIEKNRKKLTRILSTQDESSESCPSKPTSYKSLGHQLLSHECRSFLETILCSSLEDRPTVEAAIQHPWLQGYKPLNVDQQIEKWSGHHGFIADERKHPKDKDVGSKCETRATLSSLEDDQSDVSLMQLAEECDITSIEKLTPSPDPLEQVQPAPATCAAASPQAPAIPQSVCAEPVKPAPATCGCKDCPCVTSTCKARTAPDVLQPQITAIVLETEAQLPCVTSKSSFEELAPPEVSTQTEPVATTKVVGTSTDLTTKISDEAARSALRKEINHQQTEPKMVSVHLEVIHRTMSDASTWTDLEENASCTKLREAPKTECQETSKIEECDGAPIGLVMHEKVCHTGPVCPIPCVTNKTVDRMLAIILEEQAEQTTDKETDSMSSDCCKDICGNVKACFKRDESDSSSTFSSCTASSQTDQIMAVVEKKVAGPPCFNRQLESTSTFRPSPWLVTPEMCQRELEADNSDADYVETRSQLEGAPIYQGKAKCCDAPNDEHSSNGQEEFVECANNTRACDDRANCRVEPLCDEVNSCQNDEPEVIERISQVELVANCYDVGASAGVREALQEYLGKPVEVNIETEEIPDYETVPIVEKAIMRRPRLEMNTIVSGVIDTNMLRAPFTNFDFMMESENIFKLPRIPPLMANMTCADPTQQAVLVAKRHAMVEVYDSKNNTLEVRGKCGKLQFPVTTTTAMMPMPIKDVCQNRARRTRPNYLQYPLKTTTMMATQNGGHNRAWQSKSPTTPQDAQQTRAGRPKATALQHPVTTTTPTAKDKGHNHHHQHQLCQCRGHPHKSHR